MFSKVVCIGHHQDTAKLFSNLTSDFQCIPYGNVVEEIETLSKNSLVLLVGGEDISPSMYSANPSEYNYGPSKPSMRDIAEKKAYILAKNMGIPTVGICRGAQMIGVLNGFPLIQHLTGHRHNHHVFETPLAETVGVGGWGSFTVTSDHHQAVYIKLSSTYKKFVLYDSPPKSSETYLLDGETQLTWDKILGIPEIFYIPDSRSLGFQYHPEWADLESIQVTVFQQTIQKLFLS